MEVQELLGKVAQHLSVGRAFGTAYEKDGSLVIPVALVAGGGGGGEGASDAPTLGDVVATDSESDANDVGSTSGSGGGFGGVVMPVGVYVVKDDRVRWIPALNANLVLVVTFVTLRMFMRARRRARRQSS